MNTSAPLWTLVVITTLLMSAVAATEATSEAHEGLQRLLRRYPEADMNGDGILTMEEARRFRTRLWTQETEAGEPIPRDDPEARSVSPVDRFAQPQFQSIAYGELPGQVFDLWFPRTGLPPFPTVLCLTTDTEGPRPPAPLLEYCIDANMGVGIVHGRWNGDEESYFEDIEIALKYLNERTAAYGIMPGGIALFANAKNAEYALFGAFLNLEKEEAPGGARCLAIVDALPRGEENASENAYLQNNYPKVATMLETTHNQPAVALLYTEPHEGDLLREALRKVDIDTSLHNAAENEGMSHLLRMASLFYSNTMKTESSGISSVNP